MFTPITFNQNQNPFLTLTNVLCGLYFTKRRTQDANPRSLRSRTPVLPPSLLNSYMHKTVALSSPEETLPGNIIQAAITVCLLLRIDKINK